ncbi:hypothetical protein NMG60_11025081 [Bertholletia excelsa]
MEVLSFSIGVIGNIISVLVFLSPIRTFWRIIKHKSTEDFESFPYICTLLSSSLWTYYGVIKPGEFLVATINGFGAIVEAIYVTLFLIYSPRRMKAKTGILVGILDVGFFAAAVAVTRVALKVDTGIEAIGFMCAGLNIVMYGSPLAAMCVVGGRGIVGFRLPRRTCLVEFLRPSDADIYAQWLKAYAREKTVVTTKSVEFMPFFLSFSLFLNGGTWALYALLVRDSFLLVANGCGFILGSAQLVLYALYRNSKPAKNALEGQEDQHEPLM